MNNDYGMQQVCLHCMSALLVNGRCRRCGRSNTDEGRLPVALPFGYRLYTPKQRCYQIGRVLGNGGFGITYLAWDQQARRPVALKELFPNKLSRDPVSMSIIVQAEDAAMFQHFRKRFLDEAQVIYTLRNEPEIVNIYDYFEANGTGYYAMEYLQGMDMQHWLARKQGPFSWRELSGPLKQVLHSLAILHGHGLIHRDISPDNIFVCRDGTAKLIDYGSVRSQNADHFTTILKKGYAPPEQLVPNGNQGFWTDTFSLCATLYYLLSNVHPTPVYDRIASLHGKKQDMLVPLEQHKPDAPAHVIRAVMYGMNLDEKRRFRSAEEMKEALFPGEDRQRAASGCTLECVNGVFAGKLFHIQPGVYVTVGRGEQNMIAYPMDTPGVSRPQCVFYFHTDEKLYIQDRKSRYGTFLGNTRLPPSKWLEVPPGQYVRFGREVLVFKALERTGGIS